MFDFIMSILWVVFGILIAGPLTLDFRMTFTSRLKWQRSTGVVVGHIDDDNCFYVLFDYKLNGEILNCKSGMGSSTFKAKYPIGKIVEVVISPDGKIIDIPFRDYKYTPWVLFIFGLIFIISGISMILQLQNK